MNNTVEKPAPDYPVLLSSLFRCARGIALGPVICFRVAIALWHL